MKQLLALKLKILYRTFGDLPFLAMSLIFIFLIALLFLVNRIFSISHYDIYLAGAVGIMQLFLHFSRKDYIFCQRLLNNAFLFFAIEYSAISLPFIIISLCHRTYFSTLLLLVSPFFVAALPRFKFYHSKINNFF